MHRSGIVCDDLIKSAFRKAGEDENVMYIQVKIKDEKFVKTGEGSGAGSEKNDFLSIQKELKPKEPCYILKKTKKDKWLLMYYVPDNSQVKKKMLIASSYADLKAGLGTSFFVGEWAISTKDECTLEEYKLAMNNNTEDVMTWQEKEEKETAYDTSVLTTSKNVSAVVGIPIPVDDGGQKALAEFKNEEINTIIFILDPEKETLGVQEAATLKLEKMVEKLPEREPRYALHKFSYSKDNAEKEKNLFVYYCPDKSKPRLRMFYSTAKSTVLSSIEEHKIDEPKRIEISLASELTTQLVMEELHPKKVIKKKFKKPGRQGKGKAKFKGSKFQAL